MSALCFFYDAATTEIYTLSLHDALPISQLFVLRNGMETVRRFVDWAGPAIYVAMFALAIWIVIEAGGNIGLTLSNKDLSTGGGDLAFRTPRFLVVGHFSPLLSHFFGFFPFFPPE